MTEIVNWVIDTIKATTHDEYLMHIDEPQRSLMQNIRNMIKSTCPPAAEVISYGMPAFKYKWRPLVWYAVAKDRCSFYPWTNSVVVRFKNELEKFTTWKGTIRFTPDNPIPTWLIKKIVKLKMEEIIKKNSINKTRPLKILTHLYY